jgi:flagellar P-ring protein precursor FlgI
MTRLSAIFLLAMVGATTALAGVRVQDVARLQGQRINKLAGFGLVVGLPGTGDGGKQSAATVRALMALHRRYAQPVIDPAELAANDSVALVSVEAIVPEFGAREGQRVDVVVSAIGPAKSLAGGQLLVTPLQEAMLSVPDILALAGGKVELTDPRNTKRGIIRGGATLEADLQYGFISGQHFTLVLDDQHAGYGWAQMVARAITQAVRSPNSEGITEFNDQGEVVLVREIATAIDARNVRVRIPSYELSDPANFIRLALEAEIFELPRQEARVVINRTTKNVSFTGAVTIAPTVLQVPGLGSIVIGREPGPGLVGPEDNVAKLDELMKALSAVQANPDQIVAAIEHLARSGSLHAKLEYVE